MKICPKCKMITEEINECPICKGSLTFEENVEAEKEKIRFNRYYLFYLLKSCLFTLACAVAVIIKMIISKPALDYSYAIVFGVLLLSLTGSLFKRTFIRLNYYVCNERYSRRTVDLSIILSGIISVILAFAMWQ